MQAFAMEHPIVLLFIVFLLCALITDVVNSIMDRWR